ncbi:MAG: hypothetical protein ACRDRH_07115 [Pseudonocardia sp.]
MIGRNRQVERQLGLSGSAGFDAGDLGGGFQLLPEPVVFEGEPLNVRGGQFEVFGEFVIVSPELDVVLLELIEPVDGSFSRR